MTRKPRAQFNPPADLENVAGGYLGAQATLEGGAKAVFRGDSGAQVLLFPDTDTVAAPPAAAAVHPDQAPLFTQEGDSE